MQENEENYICLINEEEQFSLWFAWKEIPKGWKRVGPQGNKEDVLDYIKQSWVDITPKSCRNISVS